MTMVAEIMILQ